MSPADTDETTLTMDAEVRFLRLHYAGAIGLLCSLSTRIVDEEDQSSLDECVADWCGYSGWTWCRTLDRVDVFPPSPDLAHVATAVAALGDEHSVVLSAPRHPSESDPAALRAELSREDRPTRVTAEGLGLPAQARALDADAD